MFSLSGAETRQVSILLPAVVLGAQLPSAGATVYLRLLGAQSPSAHSSRQVVPFALVSAPLPVAALTTTFERLLPATPHQTPLPQWNRRGLTSIPTPGAFSCVHLSPVIGDGTLVLGLGIGATPAQ